MNVRNVETLAQLIREVDGSHSLGAGQLAYALASQGVLVPSALTPMQAHEVAAEYGDGLAEHLERIAKGEA